MSKALLVGLLVFASAGLTLGCSPEVPANPTYTNDVAAILNAHCVRCHGADDMLVTMPVAGTDKPPKTCYLQRYEDEGDCSQAATCKSGAGAALCYTLAAAYVTYPSNAPLRMPPAPSDPLNDWETEVLRRWSANKAPK